MSVATKVTIRNMDADKCFASDGRLVLPQEYASWCASVDNHLGATVGAEQEQDRDKDQQRTQLSVLREQVERGGVSCRELGYYTKRGEKIWAEPRGLAEPRLRAEGPPGRSTSASWANSPPPP